VITAGVNRVGPSLHAIVGRAAGTVEGFKYSDANKNSGITWTQQELFTYLENPRAKVPGTIMAFVGLRDAQQRADVIAYLKEKAK
jgi:cytochrome c